MGKTRKSINEKEPVIKGSGKIGSNIKDSIKEGAVLKNHLSRPKPADIILTKSKVKLNGTEIKIFGDRKNKIATFDSKTTTLIVHRKLMVGQIDVALKLRDLEARIQKLES